MVKKIVLSLVLVIGFSSQSQAQIAVSAKAQKVLSLAAAGVGVADGVQQIPQCFAPIPSPVACLRMVGSFGSALLSVSSAKSANTTQVQSSVDLPQGEFDIDFDLPDGTSLADLTQDQIDAGFGSTTIPEFGTVGELQSVIDENLKKAEEKGFSFNPEDGSVTGPDGTRTPASAIAASGGGSGATLAADGGSEAEALVKKFEDHFGLSSSGSSGGFANIGGGGSSYADNYKDDYDDDYDSGLGSLLGGINKKKRKPASVKGLVKKIGNGDVIGVSGDNIFEMIARGYKHKIETKQLIGN